MSLYCAHDSRARCRISHTYTRNQQGDISRVLACEHSEAAQFHLETSVCRPQHQFCRLLASVQLATDCRPRKNVSPRHRGKAGIFDFNLEDALSNPSYRVPGAPQSEGQMTAAETITQLGGIFGTEDYGLGLPRVEICFLVVPQEIDSPSHGAAERQ